MNYEYIIITQSPMGSILSIVPYNPDSDSDIEFGQSVWRLAEDGPILVMGPVWHR